MGSLFFFFYSFFICLFLPILSILKTFVIRFSGTIESGILKLGILMENELLYYGIYKWAHCFLFLPISIHYSLFPQFSKKVCKLQSSNTAYIWRMKDCIVGLRLRLIPLVFLSFPILPVNIENLCNSFLMNRLN